LKRFEYLATAIGAQRVEALFEEALVSISQNAAPCKKKLCWGFNLAASAANQQRTLSYRLHGSSGATARDSQEIRPKSLIFRDSPYEKQEKAGQMQACR
jgi:hypothetical protein